MNKNELLSGVADTLYIPLVARVYASEKFPNFFYDEKALSLKQHIPTNSIESNTTEYFYMASVCRQQTIDKKIISFIEKNNECNIVFLGAGLETSYNRIKNVKVNFYQIDLPDVMFTLDWIKEIDTSLPTMIVVAGVYQYFDKEKIVDMIKGMKSLIPNGELIFDATNSKGLEIANKYVKQTGNEDAQMYFSVDDPKEFASCTNTGLVEVTGFFDGALKHCKGLKLKTRIYMYFADKLNRTKIIHLSF